MRFARSSFYAWLDGQPRRAQRAAADAELAERIRVVHQRDNTQGAPRIAAELNDGAPPQAPGQLTSEFARVMRKHGITGLRLRRRVRTTVPEPADQKVPDLLNRDFTADAANQRYVGDITYLPLADRSNLYLATVIDFFSRRLAGWAIAEHMRTELIADALTSGRTLCHPGLPSRRYASSSDCQQLSHFPRPIRGRPKARRQATRVNAGNTRSAARPPIQPPSGQAVDVGDARTPRSWTSAVDRISEADSTA